MQYTLGLALLDFLPVSAFLIGALFLTKLSISRQAKAQTWLFMAGGLMVFLGGFLKATWKLLYTLNIADLQLLSQLQFVMVAPGFLMMFIAVLQFTKKQIKTEKAIPAIAVWKIPLLAVMTLSCIGMHGVLVYVAFRKGLKLAGILFILATLCVFAMSGMASGSEQTVLAQWIEEIINSIGQSAFAIGSILFYKRLSLKEGV
jgi:hypothetical protein